MININQQNQVRQQEENEYIENIQLQDNLIDTVTEYVSDNNYVQNYIQSGAPSQYVAGTNPIVGSPVVNTFQIPIGVINFSKTILSFLFSTTGNVGGNNLGMAVWSYYLPFIQKIEYRTSDGIKLFDCQNIDLYNRLTGVLRQDYKKNSGTGMRGFMQPSQRDYSQPLTAQANMFAGSSFYSDPYVLQNNVPLAGQTSVQTVDDPAIMYGLPVIAAPGNSDGDLPAPTQGAYTYTQNYSLRIGDLLPDSIFNVNSDIYMSKASYLTITFQPYNKIGGVQQYDSTAALYQSFPAGGNAFSQYGLTNLQITTFTQSNSKIVESIIDQQRDQGIPIVIPFLENQSQSFSGGNTQSPSFKISTSNAITNLLCIYYGLLQPSSTIIDTNNLGESKFTQVMVKINNTTIRSGVNLSLRADLAEMQKWFPNNSMNSYRAARYSGVYAVCLDADPMPNIYDGHDLKGIPISPSNDLIITYNTQTAGGAYQHHMFAVTLRVFFWKNGSAYTNAV